MTRHFTDVRSSATPTSRGRPLHRHPPRARAVNEILIRHGADSTDDPTRPTGRASATTPVGVGAPEAAAPGPGPRWMCAGHVAPSGPPPAGHDPAHTHHVGEADHSAIRRSCGGVKCAAPVRRVGRRGGRSGARGGTAHERRPWVRVPAVLRGRARAPSAVLEQQAVVLHVVDDSSRENPKTAWPPGTPRPPRRSPRRGRRRAPPRSPRRSAGRCAATTPEAPSGASRRPGSSSPTGGRPQPCAAGTPRTTPRAGRWPGRRAWRPACGGPSCAPPRCRTGTPRATLARRVDADGLWPVVGVAIGDPDTGRREARPSRSHQRRSRWVTTGREHEAAYWIARTGRWPSGRSGRLAAPRRSRRSRCRRLPTCRDAQPEDPHRPHQQYPDTLERTSR